jgi:hypothetical protein
MRIKIIFAAVLLLFFAGKTSDDYASIFGDDYSWAVKWLKTHNADFETTAAKGPVAVNELKAIVLPELIRYNGVYDAMEIQSLKFLYISRGKTYADFSVGYFQMKPSFAEQVEADAKSYLSANQLAALGFDNLNNAADNEESRKARVSRIISVDGQLNYLLAFYEICSSKFKEVQFATAADRVRFFATCYNAGYHYTEAQVKEKMPKKYFHTGKFITSDNYCYSDICADWFKKQ